jgi:zeta-carotene desaturase
VRAGHVAQARAGVTAVDRLDSAAKKPDFDVIVVGGGIAGVTCTSALVREGLRVLLLEREPVLGGRARSFTEPGTGDVLPIGPHVFLDNYANLLGLLELLGTLDRLVWDPDSRLTVADGAHAFEARLDRAPAPLHFLPALLGRAESSPLEIAANLPALLFALQVDENDVTALDSMDAASALRRLGVPERSLSSLWALMALAILNVPLERCSAGALFRFARFLLSRRGARFGYADRGLGDLFDEAASVFIRRAGGEVRTNTSVRAILDTAVGRHAVRLADGSTLEATELVLALPALALSELLPPAFSAGAPELAGLDRWEGVPYTSVFLWFDRKLTQRRMWARAFRPEDFGCDFYDLSNVYRGYAGRPSLIAANVIYSHRVLEFDDDRIAAGIAREVAEFLPAAREARVVRRSVQRIPLAIHAPFPGSERRRPATSAPVAGLFLAGDWTRTGLPSSMESAARSGWLAAEAVLERRGKPRSLARPPPAPELVPASIARAARLLPFRPTEALIGRARPGRTFSERRHAH